MHKKTKHSSKGKHTNTKQQKCIRNQDENCLLLQETFPHSNSSHEELAASKQDSNKNVTNLQSILLHDQTITLDQNKEGCLLKKKNDNVNLYPFKNLIKICHERDNLVREFFLHYLCQVCKQIPEIPILCKKCEMITYCSDEHRRKHWPSHMEICEAIEEICKKRNLVHLMQDGINLSTDEFKNYRFVNLSLCEQLVTRKLELWEREIFLHPNVCEICYEFDNKKLYNCKKCHHTSFCYSHKNDRHNLWCYALIQYRELVQYYFKYGVIDVPLSNTTCLETYFPLISGFKNVLPETMDLVHYLELTEIASVPLTALHALQLCCEQLLISSVSLEIHLIGAESNFETNYLEKWELYFIHLIPNLKYLKVVFIGPELNVSYEEGKKHINCDECKKKKKYLEFQYISALYHDYAKSKTYTLPGIICAFNPGLYRTTGHSGCDTWPVTIKTMFSVMKIPIVLTAYTKAESELDLQRVKTIQTINIVKGPCKNPFSSLKPSLNFITEDETPVIFKNFYYTIIKME